MSRFTDAQVTTALAGKRLTFTLDTDLTYEAFCLGSGLAFHMKKGATADMSYPAWLPQWIVNLIPIEGMKRALFVHDISRRIGGIPKLFTDYLFWEAMGVEGTPRFWRTVCALAVLPNASRH